MEAIKLIKLRELVQFGKRINQYYDLYVETGKAIHWEIFIEGWTDSSQFNKPKSEKIILEKNVSERINLAIFWDMAHNTQGSKKGFPYFGVILKASIHKGSYCFDFSFAKTEGIDCCVDNPLFDINKKRITTPNGSTEVFSEEEMKEILQTLKEVVVTTNKEVGSFQAHYNLSRL